MASKRRRTCVSVDGLPWKTVSKPKEAGLGDDNWILELEEAEGVEVLYEETTSGKVVKFNVPSQPKTPDSSEEEVEENVIQTADNDPIFHGPVADHALPVAWQPISLHPLISRVLLTNTFLSPTPIQAQAIPVALAGRDVIGVAETGSGKTLAYGLPIIHHLLSQFQGEAASSDDKRRRVLRALILTPTRELALQVESHLKDCVAPIKIGSVVISIAAIVGGIAPPKQRRILDRGVDILVATPGRLWDTLVEDEKLASQVKHLRFLVLDEADRMIEAGHFAELDNILRLTLRHSIEDHIVPDLDNNDENQHEDEPDLVVQTNEVMQTFIFSATLSKSLQINLKKRSRSNYKKMKDKASTTLDELLLRLDFRDPEPVVIDITPERNIIPNLLESKIECLSVDKDVYLYYFLVRYPGRSLVFLNSIDGIRRLLPVMVLLGVKAFPLHSQLKQRQRLSNLDRFASVHSSVLLATDIAARGLDIPDINHVIHYQIPRSADAYVHRKGRTARAMKKGFSLLMCAPDEVRLAKGLMNSLKRDASDVPSLSIDLDILNKLKTRVQLARKIDNAQRKMHKQKHDQNWLKQTAEAMDIELDSDIDGDNDHPASSRKQGSQINSMKAELQNLLAQPIFARGVSANHITLVGKPFADELIAGQRHETLLGLDKTEAESGIRGKRRKTDPDAKYEEWHGITSS